MNCIICWIELLNYNTQKCLGWKLFIYLCAVEGEKCVLEDDSQNLGNQQVTMEGESEID